MRTVAAILLTLTAAVLRADVSAIYGEYGPRGPAPTRRPTLSWVVTPTGGGKVTRVEMTLNRARVSARFDESSSAIEYEPASDLLPGLYTVDCRATIDDDVVVRQDWSFEVPSGSGSSAGIDQVLAELNRIRASLGRPAYAIHPAISQAAISHTAYQSQNGITGHFEEPNKPGFSGTAPWDRVQKFGYPGTCFEVASGGISDPVKALRMLFDAPYHRIAFLQPGKADVGIGFDGQSLTLDCGVSDHEGKAASPAPGQTDVPLTWDGIESPSPLRMHRPSSPVGYPIVFAWFTARLENVSITSMRLEDAHGCPVEAYVNTPTTDEELRFASVLIPAQPLKPRATYRVEVAGRLPQGKPFQERWEFTTAPS